HVADEIARSDQLRAVAPNQLPRTVAYLYDYVNAGVENILMLELFARHRVSGRSYRAYAAMRV
ncbi:hypothetical protein ACWDUA_25515, partial [Gordonia sp. NPDC003376]